MKFTRLCDTLHPADAEAVAWLTNSEEGDILELSAGTRTSQQNNALHKYLELLATALNAAGFDMRAFPWKDGVSLPWTKDACKRLLWAPVQSAMLGHDKTRDLDTKQVNQIYEALDRAISTKTGVSVEFPSRESM